MTSRRRPRRSPKPVERVFGPDEASLLDVVDNVLAKGVVLTGDATLALADVELIYLRLSLLLCAADRVLPDEAPSGTRPGRVPAAARRRPRAS